MNFLLFWVNERGERELVTPPLDGTILPGVTRQSMLDLAREWGEFKVTERRITMAEVLKAASECRILEAFGAGERGEIVMERRVREVLRRQQKQLEGIPLSPRDSLLPMQ